MTIKEILDMVYEYRKQPFVSLKKMIVTEKVIKLLTEAILESGDN